MGENSGEFYQPQTTTKIETDTNPFYKERYPRSPFAKRDIAVSISEEAKINNEKGHSNYAIVSPEHGRAIVDTRINNNVIWGGTKAGDIYGAKDWKGANMNHVLLRKDEYGSHGWRAEGLKDNVGIDRLRRASRILRDNGLPTENPIKIDKLLQVIEDGKTIPIWLWKTETIKAFESSANVIEKMGDPEMTKKEREEADSVKKYLLGTDFYVEERDLQTAERLRDLEIAKDEESFKKVVEPIFKWVNTVFDVKKSGLIANTPPPEKFSFEENDIKRYFGEWLPSQMGIYMARMHKIGLAHQFPHAQNWSVVGTLYDLDSVKGAQLGDKENSKNDLAVDTRKAVGAIAELFDPRTNNYLSTNFSDIAERSQTMLISSYIKEMFGDNISTEQLETIRKENFVNMHNKWGENILIKDGVWKKVTEGLVQM